MASDAVTSFAAEAFTLLSLGICIIFLRTYARIRQVGIRNFEADDYLMLLVIIPYTIETALAYTVGAKYNGLTNSAMTDEQRAALSPDSKEYHDRIGGSKIQVAGWTMYATVLWVIKSALCAFYFRLTHGLAGYKIKIYIGIGLIASTYIAIVASLLFSCRPFHHFWQINPNPGNLCQPASSKLYIFLIVALNIVTDLYLILIPIPMLWGAQIPKVKKIGLVVLFSGGIFVMVAGLLRCVLILKNPKTGPQEGASWAVRESFVAVATSSLPMTWGWMRQKLRPFFGSLLSSDNKYKNGPEPGSIMLGDTNDRTTWRSQHLGSLKSVIRTQPASANRDIFIHTGEASSDEIIPNKVHRTGITKEVEFTVSTSKAP
ncbi:hypothetical protein BGZ61DRAFT_538462 [Ilyonectria robusta]|uniref:uncharacterized protein n=1 Tax=Ilyonectria robusta TaxID=1079257 RepID=UPI001E8CFD82|nr:uncharacterized protein BGZ61DRAFT_538462 [Ilyonectria robusta]KAH8665495.1 hypothetical protein BGZ61DRAFT_538462 [Ilyonectria robusta]